MGAYYDLQMQRSSPLGYLRSACSPRKRGESGPFSKGYMIVYGGRKNCSRTSHIPTNVHNTQQAVKARSNAGRTSNNFREKEQMNRLL